ncbi:transcription termination factor NusA [Candidatus Woesebacteria bacterium RIFCSPLOWO2_01_FULL_39_23]|uniref:Transcription termination/antitermination protein NusA n=2 Tax=Microgenomates group TaxID=1794810 RepID=A0A0H4T6C6_9BACT|nr:NusA antitermination factor, N utilization substance protein A [uncultured Microgenomates bacterium Rifle_16ft_4_minimus_37633]OGM13846.1 MAG: transcription termination factor NusA [Candidatus Woesebacteria bacterium RBG_16_40_11]OGM27796.1 MAG: transcription termination factor NusA [Candidatus Woesebacteria bacterium RIFCSPHIGHO2_01_FULL_40_22]OGM62218.1 MAG: transcription termination factor NusA [Candidatus Woesebacteria bacterium RIFCSPLOWO2_01_FULL_39_23]
MQTPRTEFAQALRAIATERGLDPDVIIDAVKQAIIAAYKRDAKDKGEDVDTFGFDVDINPANGEARVFSWPVEIDEEGNITEASLTPPADKKDVTPPGFGRIAAQIAKQVIHQKIREAEKGALMDEFSTRVGGLISGMILRFEGPDIRVDLGRTEGIMPSNDRISSERLNPNQRLTFLLKDIIETLRGKQIILSRADPNFVQKLFEREVPEIASKSVIINAIAREAGVRTKIAVSSNQSGVDPVGSCVGQKGVRVQAVTNELGGERVDIVPYNENLSDFIKAALLPAESLTVKLDKKNNIAEVGAPEDQLSLAIGRDGQNVKLASKLTGWKIDIKGESQKAQKRTEDTEKNSGVEKIVTEGATAPKSAPAKKKTTKKTTKKSKTDK